MRLAAISVLALLIGAAAMGPGTGQSVASASGGPHPLISE